MSLEVKDRSGCKKSYPAHINFIKELQTCMEEFLLPVTSTRHVESLLLLFVGSTRVALVHLVDCKKTW